MSSSLATRELGALAPYISTAVIGRVAMTYLGYIHVEISTLRQRYREDPWTLVFEILNGWVKKNPGPNQRKVKQIKIAQLFKDTC